VLFASALNARTIERIAGAGAGGPFDLRGERGRPRRGTPSLSGIWDTVPRVVVPATGLP
jgi:hypothetical protein